MTRGGQGRDPFTISEEAANLIGFVFVMLCLLGLALIGHSVFKDWKAEKEAQTHGNR